MNFWRSCCVAVFAVSLPLKSQGYQQFVRSGQKKKKWRRVRGPGTAIEAGIGHYVGGGGGQEVAGVED